MRTSIVAVAVVADVAGVDDEKIAVVAVYDDYFVVEMFVGVVDGIVGIAAAVVAVGMDKGCRWRKRRKPDCKLEYRETSGTEDS